MIESETIQPSIQKEKKWWGGGGGGVRESKCAK